MDKERQIDRDVAEALKDPNLFPERPDPGEVYDCRDGHSVVFVEDVEEHVREIRERR